MIMKTVYIYSLCDPTTKEVRYVGKTANPFNRFWGHIGEAKNKKKGKNKEKAEWIRSLLDLGIRPELNILEEVLTDEWEEKEIYWIDKCIQDGNNLLNITKGGKTGIISEKCREALSKCKNRGHKKGEFNHSEETKALIRKKRALQVITDEHRKNISKGSTRKIKIKEVTQSGEEIIWESLTDVAKQHNLSVPTICSYIKGRVKKQKTQSKFYYLK